MEKANHDMLFRREYLDAKYLVSNEKTFLSKIILRLGFKIEVLTKIDDSLKVVQSF